MAASWAEYKQSLKDYEEKLMALSLRRSVRKLANTKFRLTRVENAQAEVKEQKRHEDAMSRQSRTEAIQEHLRSRMNSRWL